MWWTVQNIRTSTYMAIGIPKMPSMAKQSKISHGKLFRILLSTCSWLKLCFVISQAYRTRPRTIKSMTCRIPYSVKCTSVVYMSSRILQLAVGSRGISWENITACKAEKIYKMTTILPQNDNLGPFWVKIDVSLWIYSALQAFLSFSAWKKITWLNSQQPKTTGHVE